jgi:hypothetical protein
MHARKKFLTTEWQYDVTQSKEKQNKDNGVRKGKYKKKNHQVNSTQLKTFFFTYKSNFIADGPKYYSVHCHSVCWQFT